ISSSKDIPTAGRTRAAATTATGNCRPTARTPRAASWPPRDCATDSRAPYADSPTTNFTSRTTPSIHGTAASRSWSDRRPPRLYSHTSHRRPAARLKPRRFPPILRCGNVIARWIVARERTIGFKLAGFGGTWLFLLFVIVGVGYWAASSIMARLDETTTNTVRRLELAIRVDSLVSRFIADGRGAIQGSLFDDKTLSERSRADLTRHLREAKADTATLESLMRIESGRAAARRLGSLIESFSAAEAQVIGLVDKGDPAAASELAEKTTGPIQADIDKQLTTIVGNQRQFLKEDSDAADVAFARARLTMILLTLVTIAAGALAAWVVAAMMRTLRSGVHDLNVGASQVASASGQVATSAQSLSQGSTEQAASLEETSASMEEMASMTRRNAENS